MYEHIVECAKNVATIYGLDFIIPSGAVIQSLRGVSDSFWGEFKDEFKGSTYGDFCIDSDGQHLTPYGNFAVCGAWVQSIIMACFHKSIKGSSPVNDHISGIYSDMAIQAVLAAVGDRFKTTELKE